MSSIKELSPSNDQWRARVAILGLDTKEWLRTDEAVKYSRIQNPRLYELHKAGEIKSYLLKPHRDAIRGIRLWSRSSIDQYFERQYEKALKTGNKPAVVAWAKDKVVS